jgi:leader peptidase (prepilin peptidase)/N-methyltransferase
LTLGGTVIGFLSAGLQSEELLGGKAAFNLSNGLVSNYLNSLMGIVVGGGILWLAATVYLKIRKREGMGFGDIKMMMMVGAFLGWKLAWFTILGGSILGVLIGGGYMYLSQKNRRYELPFGTFLGVAAMIAALYGTDLIDWYLSRL